MFLLSGMFCGDDHSFDYTPTDVASINKITIGNGIFDDVFASRNAESEYNEALKKWDFDTALYAMFQNTLFGGNVNFTADTVSAMRIKRRKKGSYTWEIMFEIPISKNEDFAFERFDRYARGNTEYEYSLVPVINSVEGNLNTNSIVSEFDGFYLVEKDVIYHMFLNTQLSHERSQTGAVLNTLGRKYPFYINNGSNNYESGSLNATFIDVDTNNELIIDDSWIYRKAVDDFLTNGNVKILKNDEGKMWMVTIVDSVAQDLSQHWNMPVHTINWIEVGDCESTADLYDNNLIDIDSRLVR